MLNNKHHNDNSSVQQKPHILVKHNSEQNEKDTRRILSDKNSKTFLKKSDILFKNENEEFKRISEMINSIKDTKHSPFKLTKEEENLEMNEKLPIIGNNNGLLVNYDKNMTKFTFYKQHDQLLGSFTIPQLIKYLGHYWDTYDQFMSQTICTNSSDIIESFIGSAKYNKTEKIVAVVLNDYKNSPFMGNIEMLINLNNGLHEFEKNNLSGELNKVDKKIQPKIVVTVKQFIYLLVHHTLKIIAIASDNIKNDTNNSLKESLMKYSLGLVFRISQFIKEQLEEQIGKYEHITEQLVTTHNSRDIVGQKMDTMNKLLKDQNSKIDILINKLESQQRNKMIEQLGGEKGHSHDDLKLDKITSSPEQESSTSESDSISKSEDKHKNGMSDTSITDSQDNINNIEEVGATLNDNDKDSMKSEYSAIYGI